MLAEERALTSGVLARTTWFIQMGTASRIFTRTRTFRTCCDASASPSNLAFIKTSLFRLSRRPRRWGSLHVLCVDNPFTFANSR